MTAALLLSSVALVTATVDRPGSGPERDLADIEAAIERWDAPLAEAALGRLIAQAPEAAELHYLSARVRFLAGNYAAAMADLDAAEARVTDAEGRSQARDFREFVRPLAKLAERFVMVETPHFQFHFVDGPDRVLAARAAEVLESSYKFLGEEFGVYPSAKVRVEIYPDAETFQQASTLTKQEIETSGTIALCKFNRLMMMSPRLVLRGFTWCDTLCHEYVHYVLWRRNGGTVPIWLHEGIAKYEEARWTGGPPSALTPFMQQTLKGALDSGDFVTFDEMHPSFAKLPGPQEVALASAEVLSVVHYVFDTGGKQLVGKMLDALRDGASWQAMFEIALDQPFDDFWKAWQAEMRVRLAGVVARAAPDKLVELRDAAAVAVAAADASEPAGAKPDPTGPDGEVPEVATDPDDEAPESGSRYVRLGGLLHDRGMFRAAAVEYEKAVTYDAESNVLMNRLGATHRRAGDLGAAAATYRRSLALDEEYAPTLTSLGLVLHAAGEANGAIDALERAARINPYDPRIHAALADMYGALGREQERARAAVELAIVRGN